MSSRWLGVVIRRGRCQPSGRSLHLTNVPNDEVAAIAEWHRYRFVACPVTNSSPVPLKQRCTLNLSRAETSSR
ncbi:hypothetical protein TNCV_5041901 [Trichonephila clavipes]|nr:hypothetical protein TNCV_5041901 [Trichonephila clavipes]